MPAATLPASRRFGGILDLDMAIAERRDARA